MNQFRMLWKKHKNQWIEDIKLLLILGLAIGILAITHIGCPIRFVFGIPCPGCGMSRAALHVLCFHFADAAHFHPLVFLMPFLLLAWLFRMYIPARSQKQILFLVVVLFIIIYIIRIMQHDPILQYDLHKGFLYKLIHFAADLIK